MLRRHAAATGDVEAIVSDARTLGYGELLPLVERSAAALQRSGVAPGAVVGMTIADEADHLTASLALLAIGARQVTLASFDPEDVRQSLARRAGVTDVVTSDSSATINGARMHGWPPDLRTGEPQGGLPDGTLILRTSGTTGDMNLTEAGFSQLLEQARGTPRLVGERLLRPASIEHNNGKRHRIYCTLNGLTNVFRPAGEYDLVEFCLRHRVTSIEMARIHAANLLAASGREKLRGVHVSIAGGPTPISVRRAIELSVTANLHVRYAATECGSVAVAGPGEHDDDETVGRPLPGVVLEIVDASGDAVPRGSTGEIRLMAPGMAIGYLDNPEGTAKRFRNGWFWPGDMGRLRSDGQLIIEGRRDDMMILNGINIFPKEIERVLELHPAVAAAAALPLSSAAHGQIPVAAVELRPGAEATAQELQHYARQHLGLRAPRRVVVVDRLPRNPQGKLMRRELARLFQPSRTPPP